MPARNEAFHADGCDVDPRQHQKRLQELQVQQQLEQEKIQQKLQQQWQRWSQEEIDHHRTSSSVGSGSIQSVVTDPSSQQHSHQRQRGRSPTMRMYKEHHKKLVNGEILGLPFAGNTCKGDGNASKNEERRRDEVLKHDSGDQQRRSSSPSSGTRRRRNKSAEAAAPGDDSKRKKKKKKKKKKIGRAHV